MGKDKTNSTSASPRQNQLAITSFLIFIFILPSFGKVLDFVESIIFFGFPTLLYFYLLLKRETLPSLPKKLITTQVVLIALFTISTLLSINIGSSYYRLFTFANTIFVINLGLILLTKNQAVLTVILSSIFYSTIFLADKTGLIHLSLKDLGDNFIYQVWGHSYLADLIVFALLVVVGRRHRLLTILFFVVLVLTHSRSALVAVIVGLIFLKNIPKKPIILILTLILGSLIIINRPQKTPLGSRPDYWRTALIGFSQSPLFGNGPGTYTIINHRYQTTPFTNTNLAHNSFLNFLTDNGLIFTLVLFFSVFLLLRQNYRTDNFLFSLGLAGVINSLLDPSWNSPGIAFYSFFFLLSPTLTQPNPHQKTVHNFLKILSIILFIFFLSKTTSDLLFLTKHYPESLLVDPFNLNSRLAILKDRFHPRWAATKTSSLKLFPLESGLYLTLAPNDPVDRYRQLLTVANMNPLDNLDLIDQVIKSVIVRDQKDLADPIYDLVLPLTLPDNTSREEKIQFLQNYYHLGLWFWQHHQPQKAINLLKKVIGIAPAWGTFHIELANMYYSSGQKPLALDQLTVECQKYPEPKAECLQVLRESPDFNPPGDKTRLDVVDNQLVDY